MSPIRRGCALTAEDAPAGAAARWGARTSSFMVFHCPQEGHLPYHLGDSLPHSAQTNHRFRFLCHFQSLPFVTFL